MSRVQLAAPVLCDLGRQQVTIAALCDDSREVARGDLLLLLPAAGARRLDRVAADYLQQAVTRGAAAVVSVAAGTVLAEAATIPHLALATMEEAGHWLRRLLGCGSEHPRCIGITGTDGKTSITWMVRQALQRLQGASWSLGTLGRITGDGAPTPLPNTTPSLLTIHHTLAEAARHKVGALVCEVSSHGIDQQRIAGIPFAAALWSNIGSDHLQDHGGMDRYVALKADFVRRVIDRGGCAVANGDQPLLVTALESVGERIFWYGRELAGGCPERHLCWRSLGDDRVELQVGGDRVVIAQAPRARFHHENLAAAAALLLHGGLADLAQLPALLAAMPVPPGRMEPVADGVFIDFAHTPEALAALLASARRLCRGRLLLVFGCGGDRDHAKRPRMGEVAARGADLVWVTADNSRGESPRTIADQVVAGMEGIDCQWWVELDRGAAIAAALQQRQADDLLLIAGKGHETYMEQNGVRTPWSDAEVVRTALQLDKRCG